MAIKNQALVVLYTAWDSSANAGKAGDEANHTLKIIKDGVANTPTNAPAEVDGTNCPGVYKLALTAGEMNANFVTVGGKSSTASVSIIPTHITTEQALLSALHNVVNIKQASISDATPTSTKFITSLTEATNNYWVRSAIEFTSGNNIGVIRQIKTYNGNTKEVQLVTPLPNAPVNGDTFSVIMLRNFIVDPLSLWSEPRASYTTPGTFGADIALQSSSTAIQAVVDSIQNVTTFAGIVPTSLEIPSTGTKTYVFYGRLFDTAGVPNDPDGNVINILINDFEGNTVLSQTAMTRTGVGAYEYSFDVASTETAKAIVVFFLYAENSVDVEQPRVTKLEKASSAAVNTYAQDGSSKASGSGDEITWVKPTQPSPIPSEAN